MSATMNYVNFDSASHHRYSLQNKGSLTKMGEGIAASTKLIWDNFGITVANILSENKEYQISTIEAGELLIPINATLEFEDGEYITSAIELPLYGSGETVHEAKEHLQYEIDTLYNDLMEDDDFSDEFLEYKTFFIDNLYSNK